MVIWFAFLISAGHETSYTQVSVKLLIVRGSNSSLTDFEWGLRPCLEIDSFGFFADEGFCVGELADRFLCLHKAEVKVALRLGKLWFVAWTVVLSCELEAVESAIPIDLACFINFASTELLLNRLFYLEWGVRRIGGELVIWLRTIRCVLRCSEYIFIGKAHGS